MIPVSVLTGFLGSGKTTLLGQLLRSPQFSRTAVIINEFGEVGLDHDLIETSEESFIELRTGCLCCAVRGDLVLTLQDILRRRDAGTVAPFDRVVIETSGLADPAPILHALMMDAALAERLTLGRVVTTVDAVNGLATLARQPESVKQIAVADHLVVTKTDLTGEGQATDLVDRLGAFNPAAKVLRASFGALDFDRLFDNGLRSSLDTAREPPPWLRVGGDIQNGSGLHQSKQHDSELSCFAILRDQPIRAVTLTLFLEVLAEHSGGDLLRLKGIVNIVESPAQPAVIHGVQHVFHPPAWLDKWPSADRRSRIIFITRGISEAWVTALLETLEEEVRDVAGVLR